MGRCSDAGQSGGGAAPSLRMQPEAPTAASCGQGGSDGGQLWPHQDGRRSDGAALRLREHQPRRAVEQRRERRVGKADRDGWDVQPRHHQRVLEHLLAPRQEDRQVEVDLALHAQRRLDVWMAVGRGEHGDLGGLWLKGRGLSVGSEATHRLSRVRRAAPGLQMQPERAWWPAVASLRRPFRLAAQPRQ